MKKTSSNKKIFFKIFLFIFLITIFNACQSTKTTTTDSDSGTTEKTNKKNKHFADEKTEDEDMIDEDLPFEISYYLNEQWHEATSLKEITGTYITPDVTIEFPLEIDGKEYLSITYKQEQDSERWKQFTAKNNMTIKEVWDNRFLLIPEIYGIEYPISDENGIQYGIRPTLHCYINKTSAIISSKKQLLIPVELVSKNLSFFQLSQDCTKIKAEGDFRFFSKTFQNLKNSFDISISNYSNPNKYGLVLSGGGGKGAYEVGVWKALNEYGLAQKIRAVSGTSVGGLNSAIFAVEPYDSIENIWITKVPDKLTQDDALISQDGLTDIINTIALKDVQTKKFPKVYVTAVRNRFLLGKLVKSKPGQYASRFNLNDEKDFEELKKKLLATSAFPVVCSPVKLADGYTYSDGGNESVGGDNTPIDPIIQNHPEIDKIFIVYLAHEPKRKIKEIDYDTKKLVHIIPTIELGGILQGTTNFTSNRIKLLIQYGYDDTVKVLEQNNYHPVCSIWFE